MGKSRISSIARYRQLGDLINTAMADVPVGWQATAEPLRSGHQASVDRWHKLMSALYDPLHAARESALRGDPSARDVLVTFLEADIYCHRSGYFKADAISALTRGPLTEGERRRLTAVVLAAATGRSRREFRSYVRLARAVDDPALRSRLETLATAPDRRTARHARWLLEGLGARAQKPDVVRDEHLSGVFGLLGLAEKGEISARDVASVLATASPGPGETDHLEIRKALMSLAADLDAIEAAGMGTSAIADLRTRFEASLRAEPRVILPDADERPGLDT